MLLNLVVTLVGLVLLALGADQFVKGAARLAGLFGIAPVVIGALVLGFGTSAPELLVSGLAAAEGRPDLAVGNIVGSNVANLTLVLGTTALVAPVLASSRIVRREAPLAVGASVVFAVVVQGGLSFTEGIVLVVVLGVVLGAVLAGSRGGRDQELVMEVADLLAEREELSRLWEVGRTVGGLVVTVAMAQVVVWGAVRVADDLGVAESFVGFSLVAAGTSMPELVTGLSAVRRGEHDLLVGNLWGSNVFNALAVAAVAGLVGPGPLDDPSLARVPVVLMLVISVAAWRFLATGRRLARWEAVLLLAAYAAMLPVLYH